VLLLKMKKCFFFRLIKDFLEIVDEIIFKKAVVEEDDSAVREGVDLRKE